MESVFYEFETLSIMNKEIFKKVATEFFYHWWNEEGNNTAEGFDKWWEDKGQELVKNCFIPDVGGSFLYELKTIAYGKGSSSERLEEIKEKLSSK